MGGPGEGPPLRSSWGPWAKEHWSPRLHSPDIMKGWHSFVLYMGKCAPDCTGTGPCTPCTELYHSTSIPFARYAAHDISCSRLQRCGMQHEHAGIHTGTLSMPNPSGPPRGVVRPGLRNLPPSFPSSAWKQHCITALASALGDILLRFHGICTGFYTPHIFSAAPLVQAFKDLVAFWRQWAQLRLPMCIVASVPKGASPLLPPAEMES